MSPEDLTDRFEHISGSETYRKRYHELEAQKLKAEEQTSFLFSKRKGVTQEKKQKKEQKEEAEKHVKMQEELVGRLLGTLQSQLNGTCPTFWHVACASCCDVHDKWQNSPRNPTGSNPQHALTIGD